MTFTFLTRLAPGGVGCGWVPFTRLGWLLLLPYFCFFLFVVDRTLRGTGVASSNEIALCARVCVCGNCSNGNHTERLLRCVRLEGEPLQSHTVHGHQWSTTTTTADHRRWYFRKICNVIRTGTHSPGEGTHTHTRNTTQAEKKHARVHYLLDFCTLWHYTQATRAIV